MSLVRGITVLGLVPIDPLKWIFLLILWVRDTGASKEVILSIPPIGQRRWCVPFGRSATASVKPVLQRSTDTCLLRLCYQRISFRMCSLAAGRAAAVRAAAAARWFWGLLPLCALQLFPAVQLPNYYFFATVTAVFRDGWVIPERVTFFFATASAAAGFFASVHEGFFCNGAIGLLGFFLPRGYEDGSNCRDFLSRLLFSNQI